MKDYYYNIIGIFVKNILFITKKLKYKLDFKKKGENYNSFKKIQEVFLKLLEYFSQNYG